MPASNARAQFVRQQYRVASIGPDTAIEALWGKTARKTTEPQESFFVSKNDAQAILDARFSLVGTGRRRVVQEIVGEQAGFDIDYTISKPTALVIDDEKLINKAMLISEITITFNNQKTRIESWG